MEDVAVVVVKSEEAIDSTVDVGRGLCIVGCGGDWGCEGAVE